MPLGTPREKIEQEGGFNAQNLANTVWAFAKAGKPATALFAAVADKAARDGLLRDNLANTAKSHSA